MPERDHYLAGVPCWVDSSQPDPERSLDFYRSLFGWDLENVMPAGASQTYFMARVRGGDVAAIASLPEGMPQTASWNTYIAVASAEETAAKVREAGGSVLTEPFDVMTSGRMAGVGDREGAVFSLWQADEHFGARVVNEHGAVNFNGLNTRDVEGAKAFYGAVFGWGTLGLGPAVEMWTVAGYGEFLERDNPGLLEQVAESGVPGFADVVASINPIG